jgi:hypothetical protein
MPQLLPSNLKISYPVHCRLKVSNGKFSLCKPERRSKPRTTPKVDLSKSYQNTNNYMFTEESADDTVQETVHDSVEMLLKNLEESPKDNLPAVGDLQSPNHHISAITSSTSSLAIDDGPPPQPSLATSQTLSYASHGSPFEASVAETDPVNLQESQKEFLFVDIPEGENFTGHTAEKENGNKYFPVFYNSTSSKLAE